MRRTVTLVLLLAACGRSETASSQIPAYLVGDPCHGRSDAQSCGADPTCQWMPLGIACAVGAPCISGVCEEVDPCRAHADQASCTADASCDWVASMKSLCPAGYPCPIDGGFCIHHPDSGCACACPLVCPEGADCPPCDCDCPPPPPGCNGSGGGTCTCACPLDCVVGGPCPPPCDCGCNPSTTTPDACDAHKDQASCVADTADSCKWSPIYCLVGENCPEGVCTGQAMPPAPEPCVCNCPECPAGAACDPCNCTCPQPPVCPTTPPPMAAPPQPGPG